MAATAPWLATTTALAEITDLALATAASRERQAEALAQGNAFAAAAMAWVGAPLPGSSMARFFSASTSRSENISKDAFWKCAIRNSKKC